MNRSARRKAFAMVLTDKVASDKFVAVDSLVLKEAKTKSIAGIMAKLPIGSKKTLLVLEPSNRLTARAAKNLPRVDAISATSLNIVDLIAHDAIVASKEAIEVLTKTYKRA